MTVRIRMTQVAIDAVNAKHERREREQYEPEDYVERARRAQDNDRADYYRDEHEND